MGLLDATAPRQCPRGHGPMRLIDGSFALNGVAPRPPGILETAMGQSQRIFEPNGQLIPLRVWRCITCNLAELQFDV